MKKTIFLMTSLFSLAASAQECCVEEQCCAPCSNFYAKAFGGANFLQNSSFSRNRASYHTGYIVGGSLGYRWCCGMHLEAEYAFRRNGIKKIHFIGEGHSTHGHFQSSSVMGNILWDLASCGWTFCNIEPFLGVGVGCDFLKIHSTNSRVIFNQKWTRFSWQVMAGVAYPIFCNTELTLDYKFHQGGSHFYNHAIEFGLLYNFCF